MKKKLVVLLMASSMALAACGSKDTAATTAAVESESTTVEESTTEETEETEEESAEETDADAESTEADAESVDPAAALAEMDVKAILEMSGITVEEDGDNYVLTYPAEMFAGLEKEVIEASLAESADGVITVNDDGSVVFELTAEQFEMMTVAQ